MLKLLLNNIRSRVYHSVVCRNVNDSDPKMSSASSTKVDSSTSDPLATPSTSGQQSTEIESDTRDVSAIPSTSGQRNPGVDSSAPDTSVTSSTSGQLAVNAPLSSIEHDPNNPPTETPSPHNIPKSAEVPEMPSSASNEGESSAPVVSSVPVTSPSGTSKEDSDKIEIMEDETESSLSPPPISEVDSPKDCCCLRICDSCCDKLFNCFNCFDWCVEKGHLGSGGISLIAALVIGINCGLNRPSGVLYWEFLYLALLVFYCCCLTFFVERGRAKFIQPIFPKRTKFVTPPPSKKNTKDASEPQKDVVVDLSGEPGTSAV